MYNFSRIYKKKSIYITIFNKLNSNRKISRRRKRKRSDLYWFLQLSVSFSSLTDMYLVSFIYSFLFFYGKKKIRFLTKTLKNIVVVVVVVTKQCFKFSINHPLFILLPSFLRFKIIKCNMMINEVSSNMYKNPKYILYFVSLFFSLFSIVNSGFILECRLILLNNIYLRLFS